MFKLKNDNLQLLHLLIINCDTTKEGKKIEVRKNEEKKRKIRKTRTKKEKNKAKNHRKKVNINKIIETI